MGVGVAAQRYRFWNKLSKICFYFSGRVPEGMRRILDRGQESHRQEVRAQRIVKSETTAKRVPPSSWGMETLFQRHLLIPHAPNPDLLCWNHGNLLIREILMKLQHNLIVTRSEDYKTMLSYDNKEFLSHDNWSQGFTARKTKRSLLN